MLTPRPFRLMLMCLLLTPMTAVVAQDEDRPQAWVKLGTDGSSYSIIVQTNAKLPVAARVSAIASNKNNLLSWEEQVGNCPTPEPGKFCQRLDRAGRVELEFPLPKRPQAGDKFKVSFAIINSAGEGSFRAVEALPDLIVSGPRTDGLCANGLIVDFTPFSLTEAADEVYYKERIKSVDTWLKANKSAPHGLAKVRIEPLNQHDIDEYVVRSFSVSPGIVGSSQDLDVAGALESQQISLCLRLDKKLPQEKFNAEVTLTNNPPVEVERPLAKTLSGPKAMGSPTASNIPEENRLGLRSFENNFNLGLLYTSSVKDVRRGNRTFRERQSRGALDLRFAPLLRGRTGTPEVRKWQPFWTPVFLDAKVATGKIADDSLSLNRILIGSEIIFRYYQSAVRGQRNKYLLSLRGVNASDRDYKRAELKGEVEFRPIFDALNRPLRFGTKSERSKLIKDAPRKEIPSDDWFGYQIEPFVGFEIGNVYRQSRAALKGEEKGDTLRRLLFGADMLFSLGRRLNLRLTDTFYLRGNVTSGRTRNYFNGVVEVPLGNFSRNAAQSIFFSFERGDQPPFSTPSVNALKFGYRVRSDFFAGGPSR